MNKRSTLIKNGNPVFDLFCDIMNAGFEKGMSQTEIARQAEIATVTVSAWVNGRGKQSLAACLKLARATGFPARRVLEVHGFDVD